MHFFFSFYNQLLTDGTLKEFSGKIVGPNKFGGNAKHYIAPSGINSVVKHFLKEAGKICLDVRVFCTFDLFSQLII